MQKYNITETGKLVPTAGGYAGEVVLAREAADRIKELEAEVKRLEAENHIQQKTLREYDKKLTQSKQHLHSAEAEVEKYKMLAEDRKDDAEVLSETIDDIIKLKESLQASEAEVERFRNLDCNTCGDPQYQCKPLRELTVNLHSAESILQQVAEYARTALVYRKQGNDFGAYKHIQLAADSAQEYFQNKETK
jgi:predicted RNase H-like nuclease (RuvC/YqgF family)